MRPADICNPHFKDEHPSSAWLRRCLVVNGVIHVTPPTSPSQHLHHARLFGRTWRWCRRDSDTSVATGRPALAAARRLAKTAFSRRPVKNDGCHGPRRLPPSNGSPRTEGPKDRLRHLNRSTPFADASLPARTRPPSPTPAATEVASLGQMLPDGFCNQDGIRGAPRWLHDLTRTAMARDSLRAQPLADPP
jgi:hypothetical protein